MAGIKALAKTQFGFESTKGTLASAIAVWRGPVAHIQDARETTFVEEDIGVPVNSLRSYVAMLGATLSFPETPATYEQLPYVFEGAIQAVQAGTQDGSGTGYSYTYQISPSAVRSPNTFTFKSGDNEGVEAMNYSFCQSFSLTSERNAAVMISSEWMGRQSQASSFDSIGTVPAGSAIEEILPQGSMYINAASNTFGASLTSASLLGLNLSYDSGFVPKYAINSGSLVFAFEYFNKDAFSAEVELTYEHDANSITEKTAWRNQEVRNIRVEYSGSGLGTSGTNYNNKLLRLDMTGKYMSFGALEDSDGNNTIVSTLKIGHDDTANHIFTAVVVNEVADLGVIV